MKYDYYKAVYDDVKNVIDEYLRLYKDDERFAGDDLEDVYPYLLESIILDDSVTNYVDEYNAEEYICHNWDLFKEACRHFDERPGYIFDQGIEYCDAVIRQYVIEDSVLYDVLQDMGIDDNYFKS